MRRIIVIGSPGAGKSAFALRLAARTGLPLVHLDERYWNPNWTRRYTREGWRETLESIVAEEAWILDGNYTSSLEVRAARADHAIVLATPRSVCLIRAVSRALLGKRPDGAVLGKEPLGLGFLVFIWRFPSLMAEEIERLGAFEELKIVVLRSDRAVNEFLDRITIECQIVERD